MEKYNFKYMTPFKFFVLQNFPFIEEDFDAITNYQLLCKLGEGINKNRQAINEIGEETENLSQAVINLQDYVNNYFDNLNVQDEINNKLDDMAQSGELETIIAEYLELVGLIVFNTLNDMKGADNLTNGSVCKTLGYSTYNDNGGSFYKIRTMTSGDTADNINLIALTNYPTLIAERIKKYRKFVVIGDSYGEGYTPDGTVTSWTAILKDILDLTNKEYVTASQGGASFGSTNTLFNTIISNLDFDYCVTDVIIGGGYNDIGGNPSVIRDGMTTVKNTIKAKFPNAKIMICNIAGCYNDNHKQLLLLDEKYNNGCIYNNISYAKNTYYALFNTSYFSSDNIHPNSDGQQAIAKAVAQAINGTYEVSQFSEIDITTDSDAYFTIPENTKFHLYRKNDFTLISNYNRFLAFDTSSSINITAGSNTSPILIGDLGTDIFDGDGYDNTWFPIGNVILKYSDKYKSLNATIHFQNKKMYLRLFETDSVEGNYRTFENVQAIQFHEFSVMIPTFMT